MNYDLLDKYLKLEKKYEKYKMRLLKENEILYSLNDISLKVDIIKNLYAYVKELAPMFYLEEENDFVWFENLVRLLLDCESFLDNEYILDISSNIDKCNKEEKLLGEIVALNRKYLWNLFTMHGKYRHEFDYYNLENYCEISCDNILSICQRKNISCHKIKIQDGFNHNIELFAGRGFHYFTILEIEDRKYLVDCTYKQFFQLKRGLLERIGIPYLSGCGAGTFMMMDEERSKIAKKIIQDGFILLTDDVFKCYMDGFLLSWRNGTYYEEINDFSYKTPYSASDYWNFLNENDDLFNYEDKILLGYQDKPLKNWNLSLKKR